MKRLVVLHQYFNFPLESGSTRTYHFAQIMRAKGWRVIVVSGVLEQGISKRTGVFKQDGLAIIRKPINFSNKDAFLRRIYSFFLFSIISFFLLLRIRSKLVFVSSTPLTIAIPVIVYKLITGRRYILEVRDVWPELPIALGVLKNRFLISCAKLLEFLAYKHASTVVSLSPGMTTSINRRCKTITPIEVPNGFIPQKVTIAELDADKVPKHISRILNDDLPFMCYTGTFGHVNDMVFMTRLMIQYSSINSEIHFILIGAGRDFAECSNLVDHAGLKERIVILPQATKEIAFLVTKKAIASFCFVQPIPELFNNSANKIPESLGLGTPVILNYKGWQSELLKKYELSFVVESRDISQACVELELMHQKIIASNTSKYKNSLETRCQKLAFDIFDLNKTFKPVVENLEKMNDEI